MIDAHVHLERGPYTIEWLMEFVNTAVKKNITTIYFLEHSHRFKDFKSIYDEIVKYEECSPYQSDWINKKSKLNLDEYNSFILKMRKEKFPVEVKFGLEICYFPEHEERIRSVTKEFIGDFLTGSVHWIKGWGFDHPRNIDSWKNRNVNQVYLDYYYLMIQLIESDLFQIAAHPDSIKCFNYLPTIDMRKIYCEVASKLKEHGMKAENSAGLYNNYKHGELGMNRELFSCFKEYEVDIVTASDAHDPKDVGRNIREMAEIFNNY